MARSLLTALIVVLALTRAGLFAEHVLAAPEECPKKPCGEPPGTSGTDSKKQEEKKEKKGK